MQNLLVSYLTLRRLIGISGLALVPLLVAQAGALDSLSAYYHSPARDTFVGTLLVISAFLSTYKGYDFRDTWCARIAAASAAVVALVPTGDIGALSATAHTAAALLLFTCFAYFSGFLFALTNDLRKRKIFIGLAVVIVGCIVGALLGGPLFILESVAVVAFATSWLVKSVELRG